MPHDRESIRGVTDYYTSRQYSVFEGLWKLALVEILMAIQIAMFRRVTLNYLRSVVASHEE